MKKVVLSFDDGRADTYNVAIPIMRKYNLTATINVATDFILNPKRYTCFISANNNPMTVEQVIKTQEMNFEIACHGHTHKNTSSDIIENIECLKKWGIKVKPIGFASPNSNVTEKDLFLFDELIAENKIKYVRSGRKVRREGLFYSILYFLQELTHSKILFYYLNKKSIINVNHTGLFYYGIFVTKNTKLLQLTYYINKIPDNCGVIIIFHSILSKNNEGYGKDKWYWDEQNFAEFCKYLNESGKVKVITNMEYTNEIHKI